MHKENSKQGSPIGYAGPGSATMEHEQAVKQMLVERYLLDELTPELRDAFEEHMFDCAECSVDLRAGAVFIREAKEQLPRLVTEQARIAPAAKPAFSFNDLFSWFRPAFAVPTFAALLAVIAYQNFATIPSLRSASTEPRITPWVSYHTGTRGAAHQQVLADRKQGAVILIELPQENSYASYEFALYDQQGKLFWTRTAAASGPADGTFSLMIPGAGLEQAAYTLAISGISPQGGKAEIDRHIFDVHFED
jgi:Putative zinc-finger